MNDIVFAGKHYLTYNVTLHKHRNWELVYCTEASGRFVFEGLEVRYQEGDVVVIPPETPHENVSEGGFTNIHLNIENATLSFSHPVVIRDDGNRTILHLFADAYYLYCGDAEKRAALLSAYGNLIVRCMTAYRTVHTKNRIAEEIEQSIVQNFANASYELDAVLQAMPYCYDYLCRIFRKEMGLTPHRYLTNLRLQAAADMLSSVYNDDSISRVALQCGFRNPLYFSRLFKKKYGVSPSDYVRQRPEGEVSHDPDGQKIMLAP